MTYQLTVLKDLKPIQQEENYTQKLFYLIHNLAILLIKYYNYFCRVLIF